MSSDNAHALVIGAGIAGLLAARVLSSHYGQVTVIDRDSLPDSQDFRGGIPQGRHVHVLLARGQRLMEGFFPGLNDGLIANGSPRLDWGREMRLYLSGRWQCHYENAVITNVITRTSLEWQVRQRVAALPNVTFIERTEVESLLSDPAHTRITGVKLSSRIDQAERDLNADLVVDTSGRRSHAPEWFTALGYDAPAESLINSFVGYASRWYEIGSVTYDWKSLVIGMDAKRGLFRGGAIGRVEGNQMVLTAVGVNKDYPPTDEADFNAFIKSLPVPDIYDVIQASKPVTPIYGYRYEGSRRQHYEKLTRRPENFILMGDSVCSFNPIYGQGMTVAAIEAQRLDQMLAQNGTANLRGFATKFQQAMVGASADAWLMATGEDLRYPGTEGKQLGAVVRLIQRYTDQIFDGAGADPYLACRFNHVMNLVEKPSIFFQPKVALHVLRYIRSKNRATAAHPASKDAVPLT